MSQNDAYDIKLYPSPTIRQLGILQGTPTWYFKTIEENNSVSHGMESLLLLLLLLLVILLLLRYYYYYW